MLCRVTSWTSCPVCLEYIRHKTGKDSKNWGVIQSNNILAESSLFAQAHRCNITVIWRANGAWKLFLHQYSSQPSCITVLCARMSTALQNIARPLAPAHFVLRLSESSANRVFPIHPTSEDWFENACFTHDTPDSQDHVQQITAALEARPFDRSQREHPFQAPVVVDDGIAPDSPGDESEITTSSLYDNSFVDDDVSQSSGPPGCTPPSIAAIPKAQSHQNANVVAPLRIMRRRRIVVSSDDESPSQPLTAPQGKQSGAPGGD